jgi:hypothetical protein
VDIADFSSFFAHYADRYMAGDADAVADLYLAPFLAVRGGRPIHLGDRAAIVDHLAGLMATYRSAGAAAADIMAIDVLAQGDSAALATVRWNVRSAEGVLVRDFRTSYQVVGPEPWRIVSYVNHDTVRPIPASE